MRLTFYSDYSLRLLMYTAVHYGELVTIQEVADAYRISKNHLMKVAFELGRKGYLETACASRAHLKKSALGKLFEKWKRISRWWNASIPKQINVPSQAHAGCVERCHAH
jgi:hypothetical protein